MMPELESIDFLSLPSIGLSSACKTCSGHWQCAMQLLRQAEVRLAKCLRANAARESEKKLFFVNFPGKNRFILYILRVGCSGLWLHYKPTKHRTQSCLPLQAFGSAAHASHVASPHTPGLDMPSQLRFLWSCWSPSEDWWTLFENHQNTLSFSVSWCILSHLVIDSPGIEAMTTCEKAGQWFPALGILMTPQARLQSIEKSLGLPMWQHLNMEFNVCTLE